MSDFFVSVVEAAGDVDLASLLAVATDLTVCNVGIELFASSTSPSSTSAVVCGLGVEASRELEQY